MAFITPYLEAAEQHGRDSGAAYELGDLQILLHQAFRLMNAEQKTAFRADSSAIDTICNAVGAFDPQDMHDALTERGITLDDGADALIAVARIHGEDSEPDHEAGDLQEFVRRASELLTSEQQAAFADVAAVQDILAVGAPVPGQRR